MMVAGELIRYACIDVEDAASRELRRIMRDPEVNTFELRDHWRIVRVTPKGQWHLKFDILEIEGLDEGTDHRTVPRFHGDVKWDGTANFLASDGPNYSQSSGLKDFADDLAAWKVLYYLASKMLGGWEGETPSDVCEIEMAKGEG